MTNGTPVALTGLFGSAATFIPNVRTIRYTGTWAIRTTYDLFAPLVVAFPHLHTLYANANTTAFERRVRSSSEILAAAESRIRALHTRVTKSVTTECPFDCAFRVQ